MYKVLHASIRTANKQYRYGEFIKRDELSRKEFQFLSARGCIENCADEVFPIPPFVPEYYTAICAPWGDTFASLGIARSHIKALGQTSCKVVWFGTDNKIVDFLRAQNWISDVVAIQAADMTDYMVGYRSACDRVCELSDTSWLDYVLRDHPEIDRSTVYPTHIDADAMHTYNPHVPTDLVLPASATKWAKKRYPKSDGKVIVLNPLSVNSEAAERHYQHWDEAIRWLLNETPHTYILVGLDNPNHYAGGNLIDLTGKTPSNMECMALVDMADGLISTCNNLSIWNLIANKPAVIAGNYACRNRNNYFRRLIDREPNVWINYDEPLDDFKAAVRKL